MIYFCIFVVFKLFNNGDYTNVGYGGNAILYLLDQNLQLSVYASGQYQSQSGVIDAHRNTFYGQFSASYYIGNFWVQGYVQAPTTSYSAPDNMQVTQKLFYQLSAGWGNASWTARVIVQNPTNYSWYNRRTEQTLPNFSKVIKSFDTGMHANISLGVTYTFGYGKKVNRGDELSGAASGTSSAILR